MRSKTTLTAILTIGFLVTGNLVGAGILGVPVLAGIDGFWPSFFAMILFGGAMFYSAYVLIVEAAKTKDEIFNYPSLYQKYLGSIGKWVAILANMLILYGLLTAYLTGGASIIAHLCGWTAHMNWIVLALFVLMTIITTLGVGIVSKYNVLLMVLLWASFVVIVFVALPHVNTVHLNATDWLFLPVAIPVIVTSFHFHNIIPTISKNLNWDVKAIMKAVLMGMIIWVL